MTFAKFRLPFAVAGIPMYWLAVLALSECTESRGLERGASNAARSEAREAVEWLPPVTVSESTDGGAAPVFAGSPTGRVALAWVSAPHQGTDGRLFVASWAHVGEAGRMPERVSELRDALGSLSIYGEVPPKIAYASDGSLYAAYLVTKIVPGERWPRNALRFAVSADGGLHWGTPTTVTRDTLFGSYDDHALYVGPDGTIYLSWLAQVTPDVSHTYIAHSGDRGRTWSRPVVVDADPACPCCRTAMATGPDGTLYVAWRKRFPGELRDIVVARSADQGATWSEPVRVHADDWHVTYCPDAGPSIKVAANGVVHVAWWTGREGAAGVQYARSTDGARSFSTAIPLGLASYSRAAHVQLGLGSGADSDLVAAAWDDGTVRTQEIVVRVSRDGGRSFGERQGVSASGEQGGFPVVVVRSDTLLLAWQERSQRAATDDSTVQARKDPRDPRAHVKAVGALQVVARRGIVGAGAG